MHITIDTTELSEVLNHRIQNSGYNRNVKSFEDLEDEIFTDILHSEHTIIEKEAIRSGNES